MPPLPDDAQLLEAFREGRREALGRVYRDHVRFLDGYVRKLARRSGHPELVQPGAVADLLQEVFVRAFSPGARRSYDGVRDFLPYLLTIARNCFIDALRLAGREIPQSDEDLVGLVEGPEHPADAWCDGRTLQILDAYLRNVPEELRGVYEQRFVLGRSQEESAVALGVSRRRVRTGEGRLRRGLRKALVRAGIKLGELQGGDVDFPARMVATAVTREG